MKTVEPISFQQNNSPFFPKLFRLIIFCIFTGVILWPGYIHGIQPLIQSEKPSIFKFGIFSFLFLLTLFSLLNISWAVLVFGNPGSLLAAIHKHDQSFPNDLICKRGFKLCKKCGLPKPPKCHHCHQCNQCILFMDHHCDAFGSCLGFQNLKIFLLVFIYGFFIAIYVIFCLIICLLYSVKESKASQIAMIFYALFMALILLFFANFYYHMATNSSATIEKFFPSLIPYKIIQRSIFGHGISAILPMPLNEDPFKFV